MPLKPCRKCGVLTLYSLCPKHKKGAWSNRDNTAQVRWARAVKKRDGWRCVVCGATEDLQAHHLQPGWETAYGATLCRAHHREADPYAR